MIFCVLCISTAHMYGETERVRGTSFTQTQQHTPEDRLITVATAAS